MKHIHLLDDIESEIIRIGELRNLFTVISNGATTSSQEQLVSSIQYIEGSLDDIYSNLVTRFQLLFNEIKNEVSNS